MEERYFIGFRFQKYLEEVNNLLYDIKGLHCSYKESVPPVLIIDELQIEKGSRVFFIGPSGVGKSTILESLGLMNNTIEYHNENAILDIYYSHKNKNGIITEEKESLKGIWDKGEKELSRLRNKIFGFIFQSNNLFSSMSGYQNIISGAIINGIDSIKARKETNNIVQDLLPDLNVNIDEDFNILEMSGGQRQRVSFARAIISDKQILFADEPTGNLDWYNAENIMKDLHQRLEEKNGTSIVVTHDINLALEFATKIVMVNKLKRKDYDGNDHYYGEINNSSVYNKKDISWENENVIKSKLEVEKELRSMFIPKDI